MQNRKSRQPKIQQNKTTLVQLSLTTLGQETRWAYSTTPPRAHTHSTVTQTDARRPSHQRAVTAHSTPTDTNAHETFSAETETLQDAETFCEKQ